MFLSSLCNPKSEVVESMILIVADGFINQGEIQVFFGYSGMIYLLYKRDHAVFPIFDILQHHNLWSQIYFGFGNEGNQAELNPLAVEITSSCPSQHISGDFIQKEWISIAQSELWWTNYVSESLLIPPLTWNLSGILRNHCPECNNDAELPCDPLVEMDQLQEKPDLLRRHCYTWNMYM